MCHGESAAGVATGHDASTRATESTQNVGHIDDGNDESCCTQFVLPQAPQAILRFKDTSNIPEDQRDLRLQLPMEPSTEIIINLGRLKTADLNSDAYQPYLIRIDLQTNKLFLGNTRRYWFVNPRLGNLLAVLKTVKIMIVARLYLWVQMVNVVWRTMSTSSHYLTEIWFTSLLVHLLLTGTQVYYPTISTFDLSWIFLT